MSNALAIAAVTAVLKDLLHSALIVREAGALVGQFDVSALPPDRIGLGEQDPNRINLFLYQVAPNPGWSNVGLPSRDASGVAVGSPPLALNLYYLLTAYGSAELHAEALLGLAMQALHEIPVLSRERIRKALAHAAPAAALSQALVNSGLAEQLEQIKITPQPLNSEEVSKLWAAFQSHYRPTAGYVATVVLIESDQPAGAALPVANRGVAATATFPPAVESVVAADDPRAPIVPTSRLRVLGQRLRADRVEVAIGDVDVTAGIASVRDQELLVQLPAAPPAGLRAGAQSLRVIHEVQPANGLQPRRIVESNAGVFLLRPVVTPTVISKTSVVVAGETTKQGQIKLTCVPPIARDQVVTLLLNEFDAPNGRAARAYQFRAPIGNGVVAPATETSEVLIPFSGVVPGIYVVRGRVDGADSVLTRDGSGQFAQPQVDLT